jgi:hypothetical protein
MSARFMLMDLEYKYRPKILMINLKFYSAISSYIYIYIYIYICKEMAINAIVYIRLLEIKNKIKK